MNNSGAAVKFRDRYERLRATVHKLLGNACAICGGGDRLEVRVVDGRYAEVRRSRPNDQRARYRLYLDLIRARWSVGLFCRKHQRRGNV
jgi:hypothetical protein